MLGVLLLVVGIGNIYNISKEPKQNSIVSINFKSNSTPQNNKQHSPTEKANEITWENLETLGLI